MIIPSEHDQFFKVKLLVLIKILALEVLPFKKKNIDHMNGKKYINPMIWVLKLSRILHNNGTPNTHVFKGLCVHHI